jgi:hypothetical protein
MSLSTSTIATLLIAGTAIGGSTAAVIISNSPVSADQQNQLQVVQPNTPGSSQQIVSGGKVTTIQPGPITSPASTPTSTPSSPATPPPSFGGGSKGGDDGFGDDGDSGFGHHNFGHHGDDNDDEGYDDGSDG